MAGTAAGAAGASGKTAAAAATDPSAAVATGDRAQSGQISGLITVNRKLTKKSVTAAVPVYQRGKAVPLARDADEDPLAVERERVVVYLEGPIVAAAAPSKTNYRMEQVNRRFEPEMVVVPVGSTVSFPNMDPIFHNIFSLSKPKEFDLGSYDKGDTRTVTFNKPGVVYVYCHLHPNMEGTVFVAPSTYFAQPDGAGQYKLPAVPPGEYTLVAWHKVAGFFRKKITVSPDQAISADFLIPLPPETGKTVAAQHVTMPMGGN